MALTVVVAPDSFKGSVSAADAASYIASGWRSIRPHDTVALLPQADGGEGTLDAIARALPGAVRRSAGLVTGPDGRPTPGEWLQLPDGTAVVELAQCSGLPLMLRPDALGSTTRGLGEVIAAAVAAGATSLAIGLGGSASTDGAAGALTALGLRVADAYGQPLADGGAALAHLASVDASGLLSPPRGGVTLLTDVTAPLLGARGAATVFGPQKGASRADVVTLEAALARFAAVVGETVGAGAAGARAEGALTDGALTDSSTDDAPALATMPGTGAAGGAGFGLAALWGARITPGWQHLARLSGLETMVASADVVITGEGRFDEQSLGGKVVGNVLTLAGANGARVGVIAGQLAADPGVWSHSLEVAAGSAALAMSDPQRWLRDAGAAAARALGA